MKRLLPLGLISLSLVFGQQPTISNISIDSLDTSSFRVFFTVSQRTWVELRYGTKPGVYPYRTRSANCFDHQHGGCFSAGKMALSIAGLKPGTMYYVLPTARPNPNDDIGICNTVSCGAIEQVVTTLPGVQPAPPRPPAKWIPVEPDTSHYAVIPMKLAADGTCVSAAAISGNKWTVNATDSIPAILGKIQYGTVLEFPQGVSCKVPASYLLPNLPLDPAACDGPCRIADPRHRWIVFRTKKIHEADFPPFGSRITPDWSAKLAKLVSPEPKDGQQLFGGENGTDSVHHFWFQNMEWTDDAAYTTPPDNLDPRSFDYFARFGSQYQTANNQFIVLDHIYAHGNGAPQRHFEGFEFGGNYQAMIGCYTAKIDTWRVAVWPTNPGKSTGNSITVPKNTFAVRGHDPLLGMTGPATITITEGGGDGVVYGMLRKDGLHVEYTAGAGTVNCVGCQAVPLPNPAPNGGWTLFYGKITKGTFSGINWNTQEWQGSRYLMAFGVAMSDLRAAGGPYYFANNYLDGVGEGFYIDAQYSNFANDDITYVMNHQIWPRVYFNARPGWNGWRYDVRQHWESKRSHRVALVGNVFSYSWSFQNDGPAVMLSGRPTYQAQSLNDSLSDFTIRSNIVSHGRTGITCMALAPTDNGGLEADGAVTRRVSITNNLLFDLGRWKYCDTTNCPSLGSFIFEDRPGCQDLVIKNNTAGPTYGEVPSWLYVGGGDFLTNSLDFENNVLFLSKGPVGGGVLFGDWPGNTVANHDVAPAPHFDNGGESPDFVRGLNEYFVNIGPTVVPNYVWKNNLIIGGWSGPDAKHIEDMSKADLWSYTGRAPKGDTYVSGKNMTARIQAAHLSANWEISSPSRDEAPAVGVNLRQLYSEQGRVTGIGTPQVETNSAQFTYQAPDERACSVDVSPDGTAWKRTVDNGLPVGPDIARGAASTGSARRNVTVTGLQSATEYRYRILCYYEQVNDGVLYTDYLPAEITNGVIRTK